MYEAPLTSFVRYIISLQATAHDAFRALVNLSDNSLLAGSLSEVSFMKFIVSYIIVSPTCLCKRLWLICILPTESSISPRGPRFHAPLKCHGIH